MDPFAHHACQRHSRTDGDHRGAPAEASRGAAERSAALGPARSSCITADARIRSLPSVFGIAGGPPVSRSDDSVTVRAVLDGSLAPPRYMTSSSEVETLFGNTFRCTTEKYLPD
jgi:hypothetical protein